MSENTSRQNLGEYFHRFRNKILRMWGAVRLFFLLDLKIGKGIKTRNPYVSYDEYVDHQKEKTLDPHRKNKWLKDEWEVKVEGFKEVFNRNWEHISDKENALCLGARAGQEVKALQSLGIQAIGIDLVPFEPYTIEGDIHDLQFDSGAFDIVFSNIFDHSLYPDKFSSEIERVLQPGGIVILHLQIGEDLDEYTETYVYDPSVVIKLFANFDVLESRAIEHTFDPMDWEVVLEKREIER